MQQASLSIRGDDLLQLVVACDTAITALDCPALETGMARGEIDHALIQLRRLRSELLRRRGELLEAAISKARKST